MPRPIITNEELAKLIYINEDGDMPRRRAFAIDGLFPVTSDQPPGEALGMPSATSVPRVSEAIAEGAKLIVLSDRPTARRSWLPSRPSS